MNWKSALTGMACGLLALPSLSNAQSAKIKMGSSLSPPSLESITPYVAVCSPADRFKAMVAGKVDRTVVTNTEVAKLGSYPEIIDLVNVPKLVPEIPYEFGMAKDDYIQKNADTLYKLAKAIIESNRWIAANKAGTIEVARKILPDEPVEVL